MKHVAFLTYPLIVTALVAGRLLVRRNEHVAVAGLVVRPVRGAGSKTEDHRDDQSREKPWVSRWIRPRRSCTSPTPATTRCR